MASKKQKRQNIKAVMRANSAPRVKAHKCESVIHDGFRLCGKCGESMEFNR